VIRRRQLFGLDFVDERDLERVAEDIVVHERTEDAALPVVVTPNVDYLVRRANAPEAAQRVLDKARWCLPDGQPIVWTSRLVGRPLAARLPGSTLVEVLWNDPATRQQPVTVIASSESIGNSVRSSRPDAQVIVAPLFSGDADVASFVEEHVEAIVEVGPQLVFVAIGFPPSLVLIDAFLERWPPDVATPVFLAVGASFEMLFGVRKRAPQWVQRAGLEWLYRVFQEPRRLFVRYFVHDAAFLPLVLREWRQRKSG
jgi:N-acetylglucosaminyldiphosphoundecaprenol N-acetyl-beta-D-mannosaminyltransferase